ncbi:MAG TPA: single-stranded DNA-binding protein [candidate division CPR3 bacterium]|uniref:Single-stranded DNA-binding protein n=1 Tax=candidate division CPR3 bacterium TaxID=2268181 RepID=A0A7C1SP23_UNCC3|nr:single-stranded DNA-binding protein [candidate division CPR3 bacterium]
MATSRSLNKAMLIGNLTRDPVLRDTANGGLVSTFGLATNATWKDSDGNIQERTEFHNVVSWNKLAEITAQILSTGMLVYIEGELRTRTWDDENGMRHYKTEVKINDMKLLDSKGKAGVGIDEAKQTGGNGNVQEKEKEKEEGEEKEDQKVKEVEETKETKEEASPSPVKPADEELSKEAEDLF